MAREMSGKSTRMIDGMLTRQQQSICPIRRQSWAWRAPVSRRSTPRFCATGERVRRRHPDDRHLTHRDRRRRPAGLFNRNRAAIFIDEEINPCARRRTVRRADASDHDLLDGQMIEGEAPAARALPASTKPFNAASSPAWNWRSRHQAATSAPPRRPMPPTKSILPPRAPVVRRRASRHPSHRFLR